MNRTRQALAESGGDVKVREIPMASRVRCPACGQLNYSTDPICLNCGADLLGRRTRPRTPPPAQPADQEPHPSYRPFQHAAARGMLLFMLVSAIIHLFNTWPAHASFGRYLLVGVLGALALYTVVMSAFMHGGRRAPLLRAPADRIRALRQLWWYFALSGAAIVLGLYRISVASPGEQHLGYFGLVIGLVFLVFGVMGVLLERSKEIAVPDWYYDVQRASGVLWTCEMIFAIMGLLALLLLWMVCKILTG